MKKFKKSVVVVAALLLITSNLNASENIMETCEEQATEYMEAYEYYFGCIEDAEQFNWMFDVQVGLCEENRNQN